MSFLEKAGMNRILIGIHWQRQPQELHQRHISPPACWFSEGEGIFHLLFPKVGSVAAHSLLLFISRLSLPKRCPGVAEILKSQTKSSTAPQFPLGWHGTLRRTYRHTWKCRFIHPAFHSPSLVSSYHQFLHSQM